ncbi:hypothetical protein [Roseateles sp. LYH14W]|uniref:DUF2946 domain-containing protein n=1 Tax=Pelomonas parva TaxID=3299032 RepID=A0ABW7F478_9BURK
MQPAHRHLRFYNAPIVIRWMRTFILVLLLPAYGFAAVHVEPYLLQHLHGQDSAAASPAATPLKAADGDHGDSQVLLSELSDTSDDVCDHCVPFAYAVTALRVRQWRPVLDLPQAPDAVLRRALRPPSDLLL